jgi:FkbM family methyltransferase
MLIMKNILPGSIEMMKNARSGKSLRDKLNILILSFLVCPEFINRGLRRLVLALVRRTIVTTGGVNLRAHNEVGLQTILPSYEKWAWHYLNVKEGEVFLRYWCTCGKYTCQIANRVRPNGLVIAIEPDPVNYYYLLLNAKENKLRNVVALNIAAWNRNYEINLYLYPQSTRHSLKSKSERFIKVIGKKLDDILKCFRRKVKWVKIDAEGAEIEVLEGLKSALKEECPKMIVEVTESNTRKFLSFMRKIGYNSILIKKEKILYFYCFSDMSAHK